MVRIKRLYAQKASSSHAINFRSSFLSGLMSVFLLLALVSLSYASPTKNPQDYFFDTTFGDFSEELANAKEEGKQGILVFFEMDECPFCHWMKMNVLNQTNVQEYYKKNFLIFSVDIEGDVEITNFNGENMTQKDFAFKENRVRATPVIAFFDLDGKRVMRFTGRTSSADEFLLLGKFVADKEYNNTKFSKYKRLHKK